MDEDSIYCTWSGCERMSILGYSPTPRHRKVSVCQKHWEKICDAEGTKFGKAMLQLGYSGIQEREHRSELGDDVMAVAEKTKKRSPAKATKGAGSSKRKVGIAWVDHFRTNAGAASKDRLTDVQIQKSMRKEFPDRESWEFTNERGVNRARTYYNKGGFTHGDVPRKASEEYDRSGSSIPSSGRGRPKKSGAVHSTGTITRRKKSPEKKQPARSKSVKKSKGAKKA